MVVNLSTPAGMVWALLPEIVLSLWGIVAMLATGWRHKGEEDQRFVGQLALTGLVAAMIALIWLWSKDVQITGGPGMVAADSFRYAASFIFLMAAILTVVLSMGYVGREKILTPEYYVLLVFATVGTMVMSAASDLLLLFLGIEVMSISVYALVGINRRSVFSAEAALKYFLMGAFASAFVVYGITLIYGATGTTNFAEIDLRTAALALQGNGLLVAGIGLLLIGFAFKVAAVPFHMWAPDAYDGAPTPITAFMAAAVKAAGFAALIRLTIFALGDSIDAWQPAVWWLAVVTMIAGNLMALSQRRVKRMLAYSSVGHAGYLLVAVISGTETGAAAFLFYAFMYTLVTLGAFGAVSVIGRNGERELLISDLAGLASSRPWLSFAITIFMLSLLGFPGTAGFIGKWYILSSAIEAGQWTAGILLVVASVISAGYYLPVIMEIYMKPPVSEDAHESSIAPTLTRGVLALAAGLLLLFGVFPGGAMNFARESSDSLKPAIEVAVSPTETVQPSAD